MGHRNNQHSDQGHRPQPGAAGHTRRCCQGKAPRRIQDTQRHCRGRIGEADEADCRHSEWEGGHANPLFGGDSGHGFEWKR